MSIISKNVPRQIDGEEAFALWVELGSIMKVGDHLASIGKINEKTGNKFTAMGIWNSAIKWCTDNPEKAWPYYVEAGTELTKEQWEEWLVRKAVTVRGFSKDNFLIWIKERGYERYSHIYAEKYGVS